MMLLLSSKSTNNFVTLSGGMETITEDSPITLN